MNAADKDKIGLQLMRRLAQALKNGEITGEDSFNISSFIEEHIGSVKTNDQMGEFLRNLSQNWPIFSQILVAQQMQATEAAEDKAVGEVSNLIKENKIDEALTVAKNAAEEGSAR